MLAAQGIGIRTHGKLTLALIAKVKGSRAKNNFFNTYEMKGKVEVSLKYL